MTCFECSNQNCDLIGIALECTAEAVLHTHGILSGLNPLLESVAPANADYACFLLNSSIAVDNGHSIAVVNYGCTFWQTKFCDGWDDDVMVHDCQVCHADECNAISGNAPEPPRPSTTTQANPGTTGGGDRQIRIGTKLVIGGLSLMLIFL